jgi:hypothetical protein
VIEAPLWTDGCNKRTGLNHDKYNVHCSEKVMYDRNLKLVIIGNQKEGINGVALECI